MSARPLVFHAVELPDPDRPEAAVLQACLSGLDQALDWGAVQDRARPWVEAVRLHGSPPWALERLLQEHPISSAEGLALMRLAEALLRVPDAGTALALTVDQLGRAQAEGTPPVAGEAGTPLSGQVLALAQALLPGSEAPGLLARLGGQAVVAATVRAVQLLGRQFVLGQDLAQARRRAQGLRADARHAGRAEPHFSFDMLGEGARSAEDAARYLAAYTQALSELAQARPGPCVPGGADADGISVKLSALHPRYEEAQRPRVLAELLPRLSGLCDQAAAAGLQLTLDAEESERLGLSLSVFEALSAHVARHCPGWAGLGLAVQAYQTRAPEVVAWVVALARRQRLRLTCRLVKGAYWDSEVKRAQELGLAQYPVFTRKAHTDASYLACAQALLAAPDAVFPQFATHNAATVAAVLQLAERRGAAFELQRLHGMGSGLYRVLPPGLPVRVYAPVGTHRELLAYLVRRLIENGANASFVHRLADPAVPAAELLASPLAAAWAEPGPGLPLPEALFGATRRNSAGLDLALARDRAPLQAALAALPTAEVVRSGPEALPAALARAQAAQPAWAARPVAERADALRGAADALQAALPEFSARLVAEGRKTWGDAVAEVREAVDFLRYYAAEAERVLAPQALPGVTGESNRLGLRPRGVWACISPWNFPLAIFTGQVAAALVTGNAVLAKPAEQTPAVAAAAVRLLHQAGVPEAVLQLLHGPGQTLGAALVALPGLGGVAFTGSTAVAKRIQRALAAQDGPIVPLIAETGGLNAMLVDSTALPEQVADAVLQSAFRSAGQRCSALRLLCLHEAVAERVLALVRGAAAELVLGDPADFGTDVGPLIDAQAEARVAAQVRALAARARALPCAAPAPRPVPHLVPPQLYEIDSLDGVDEEIFGPVLQVLRWGRGALREPQAVIEHVNALGHGLTLGLQTRIEGRAQALAALARAGNVYVNRNMVGAVVGSQPFGGQGLSGTGPKAGGPHYLPRFCTEQTLTINTAAAGGNAALLAGLG